MKKKLAALLLAAMIAAKEMTVWAAPIDVPADVRQISIELGTLYGICPEVIQSTCFKESSFDPQAENGRQPYRDHAGQSRMARRPDGPAGRDRLVRYQELHAGRGGLPARTDPAV